MSRVRVSRIGVLSFTLYSLAFFIHLPETQAMNSKATKGQKVLMGHVPRLPAGLLAHGEMNSTNELRLAIGVPLRDPAGLDTFLAQVSNPASAAYRHYLTPLEFTERFGPTEDDYRAVMQFANTNGLTVTATYSNRLVLDVKGPVRNIERAFRLTLLSYRHPTEGRDFFAPDREPSVDVQLPIADVSGLNNYVLPHPRSWKIDNASGTPRTGSGSGGAYIGGDFRAAYLPGVTLTGAGQSVGLLQFDGYYTNDILAYATAAGITAVPVVPVLLDGYDGTPTTGANSGNPEVSLDIEMCMAMAPGLSQIIVYEAGPSGAANDILNAMVNANQAKQLSSSWAWSGGPTTTTDNIFKQMATQGQTFFEASGDSDAYTTGANSVNGVDNVSLPGVPSSNPYITLVGGTTLSTTGPGGVWASETTWNWGLHNGNYVGSSGGISSYYSLPTWQSGINMTTNGGATTNRNIPDVALTADNVFVNYGSNKSGAFGGTSCAAPLWAGLTALINEQASIAGKGTVGFLNTALYTIGQGPSYVLAFHDITTGDNTWPSSPNQFYAAAGYDLCTGWGTPAGQPLIDSLAGVANSLTISPPIGFTSTGPVGGPFNPVSGTFTLSNSASSSVSWALANATDWLNVSPTNGTLGAGGTTQFSATLNAAAGSLSPGTYTAPLLVTNLSGGTVALDITLLVGQSLVQNGGFETGDFTGWTLVGDTTIGGNVYNAVETEASFNVVHSGTYGAFLGDTLLASLSQNISTIPGQHYLLSLWLNNDASGTVQQFYVNWNGSTLFHLLNPPAFSWTNLQFLVTASGTSTPLQFQAENDPSYFGLDDVNVSPVPTPVFQNITTSGNNLQLSWLTTTGLVYQVQYKTNLFQANWLNLSAPFLATSSSSSIVDTNALRASPQRFYRLQVAP